MILDDVFLDSFYKEIQFGEVVRLLCRVATVSLMLVLSYSFFAKFRRFAGYFWAIGCIFLASLRLSAAIARYLRGIQFSLTLDIQIFIRCI